MRLCCYRDKEYEGVNRRRLMRVLTIAYVVEFGENTTVTYSAVEWKYNGHNNWNKRKNFQYAKQRMQKKPLIVTFSNLEPPLSYYHYRRLEKFLVQDITEHGIVKRQPIVGPAWIIDPVLTTAEEILEKDYAAFMTPKVFPTNISSKPESIISREKKNFWDFVEQFLTDRFVNE